MKQLFILLSFIFITAFAQAQDTSGFFNNVQGMIQEKAAFYTTEGYSVYYKILDKEFNSQTLDKIRSQYGFSTYVEPYTDSAVPLPNKVFRQIINGNQTIYYVFPFKSFTRIIGFTTPLDREKYIEYALANAIINDKVPDSVYATKVVEDIDFAGRRILLGSLCRWQNVNDVKCDHRGQMSWSEYRNKSRADSATALQLVHNGAQSLNKVLQQDSINVVFEGVPVRALKVTYKIKLPKLVMGGSNQLTVYYITVPLRGRYVSCLLSYFSDEGSDDHLPSLLREVMTIKS